MIDYAYLAATMIELGIVTTIAAPVSALLERHIKRRINK